MTLTFSTILGTDTAKNALLTKVNNNFTEVGDNLKQAKLDATTAPTVTNDVNEGYAPGSLWVDVTNDKGYLCLDNTASTAVWVEITASGAENLNDLSDVIINTPTSGHVLRYDGIDWVNTLLDIDLLNDTNISGVATGHVLRYDGVDWSNTMLNMNLLDDVSAGSPASGDILYYDGLSYVLLNKGTDGQVLELSSGVPSWQTPSGGGSFYKQDTIGGPVEVGTILEYNFLEAITISDVQIRVRVKPAGANIQFQAYKMTSSGDPVSTNSIFTSDANLEITTAQSEETQGGFVTKTTSIDNGSFAVGDRLVLKIIQVGSTVNGSDFGFIIKGS